MAIECQPVDIRFADVLAEEECEMTSGFWRCQPILELEKLSQFSILALLPARRTHDS